jgi:hypothetical protein
MLAGDGVTVTVGAAVPVPKRYTGWVAPATLSELSVSVRVPVRAPTPPGTKSIPTTQEPPAAIGVETEHVVVPESMTKFAPGGVMLVKFSGALPMF